jgi:hypothetical protein
MQDDDDLLLQVWIGQTGFEQRVGRIAYIMVVVHVEEHHHAFHLWRTQNGQDVCKPLNHQAFNVHREAGCKKFPNHQASSSIEHHSQSSVFFHSIQLLCEHLKQLQANKHPACS